MNNRQLGTHCRAARLIWYGFGLLAIASVLVKSCSSFVTGPGAVPPRVSEGHAAATAATVATLIAPAVAWAKGGEYGPLEGKASSLVHPIIMPLLFLATLYTGFLGWQWRRTRLIGGEISELKAKMPKAPASKEPAPELEKLDPEHQKVLGQIEELTAARKELVAEKYKDKHYQTSAVLLGGGMFFTVYGIFNTFFRTSKLFPGPHLYAGAGIGVLWALSAACVPFMEKGNESARVLHIGFNALNVLLFCWQLPTGFEILMKVWGNANLAWF